MPGLKHFPTASTHISASSFEMSSIEGILPGYFLCEFLDVPTPKYTVSRCANDLEKLSVNEGPLGLQILYTAGHTSVELPWYDELERRLYIRDSFYARVAKNNLYEQASIFPKEGNWVHYMQSLEMLLQLARNQEKIWPKIWPGLAVDITSLVDGMEILVIVRQS